MTNKFTPTHRHVKTGGEYMLVGSAFVQTRMPLTDGTIVMIYEAANGRLFVRPRSEFYDGRFKTLKEPSDV